MTSKIEWLRNPETGKQGYTLNPVKGLCPVGCSYCYARRMYKRFKWNPAITWHPEVFDGLDKIPSGSKVFIGSTMELFGDWVKHEWMLFTMNEVRLHPDLTFIFLTKHSEHLPKEFPDNCWVGVSATEATQYYDGVSNIAGIKASIKFVSFEPLLEQINGGECAEEYRLDSIKEFDWCIIGQQTPPSKKTEPKIEWIEEIVEACDYAGVPVFIKDNLSDLLFREGLLIDCLWTDERAKIRQEFPV